MKDNKYDTVKKRGGLRGEGKNSKDPCHLLKDPLCILWHMTYKVALNISTLEESTVLLLETKSKIVFKVLLPAA